MGFKKQTAQKSKVSVTYPVYTNQVLDEFGKWLEQFLVHKTVINWKTKLEEKISFIDLDEAMVAFGAVRKIVSYGITQYAVIWPKDPDEETRQFYSPIKWDLFRNKYQVWQDRKEKRNFAEQKQFEGYEQMLEGVEITHDFPK